MMEQDFKKSKAMFISRNHDLASPIIHRPEDEQFHAGTTFYHLSEGNVWSTHGQEG